MAARVLITGAGTGGSNNLVRSLRAGDPSLVIVGCHDDRFVLKKSAAERNHLVPSLDHPRFAASLRHVIGVESINLLIPTTDADVRAVSRLRRRLPCRVFLPRPSIIALCHDKYRLTVFLRGRGIPAPLTYPVRDLAGLGAAFARLGQAGPVWCRVRTGTGSIGAIQVRSPEQARSWIRCWRDLQGLSPRSFTLSEYLPGRDFACQSLWQDGRLILIKTCERLSYFGGESHPSGRSSIAALARTGHEPAVVDVCTRAVRALDARASGAFSLDLKADVRGVPNVTEVNIGRLLTGTNIFDLAGKRNMAVTYVRLALGEPVEFADEYDAVEDYYMLRDLDTLPGIFHASEFFEGIEDARR